MTRLEHLLTQVAEECAEVAQRASKANRFGLGEVQDDRHDNPDHLTNRERLVQEFNDLVAVLEMIGISQLELNPTWLMAKQYKVEKYLRYAKTQGTLTED